MQTVIKTENLTKDYGGGCGIFDINLDIKEGEMLGFAGTNGSGKTTTIRNIMGFLQPTSGYAYVNGLEAWRHSSEYVKNIGYVQGEIAFPDLKTGIDFLRCQADFLHMKDFSYAEQLIEKLQLDPKAPLKRMSKGMKQKTAIVAALMTNPSILILDEPTTGLEPLMRDAFLEIIKEEHKKGKTIFMSSHMLGELEATYDKVALISNGKIEYTVDMDTIKNPKTREYKIEFNSKEDYEKFKQFGFSIVCDQQKYCQLTVEIPREDISSLFGRLRECNVKFIAEVSKNLERYFRENINLKKEQNENVQ